MGFLEDARDRARAYYGREWSGNLLKPAPDMGSKLNAITKVDPRGWTGFTIRIVDGLFQTNDARSNRNAVIDAMGLTGDLLARDSTFMAFANWPAEVQIALQVGDFVNANPDLKAELKAWELADTEERRAESRANRLGSVLELIGGAIALFGIASALSPAEPLDDTGVFANDPISDSLPPESDLTGALFDIAGNQIEPFALDLLFGGDSSGATIEQLENEARERDAAAAPSGLSPETAKTVGIAAAGIGIIGLLIFLA